MEVKLAPDAPFQNLIASLPARAYTVTHARMTVFAHRDNILADVIFFSARCYYPDIEARS